MHTNSLMCAYHIFFFFFLQGREKRGGGVVMLIKAAHLQPIKEPLSFIKANLLKQADAKTSRLCCTFTPTHSLFISPLPLSWPADGTWPSNPVRNVRGCVWMHLAEKQRQSFQLKHLCRADRLQVGFFGLSHHDFDKSYLYK